MTSPEQMTVAASTERQAKRAAVMIADMVAFSRRMEQDQAGSVGQVTRSIQLFRALIGDYGGQIANLSGDGILALFESADKALQFAVQIQTEFRDQSVWGDGEPIQFRVGLNIGEVTFHEFDRVRPLHQCRGASPVHGRSRRHPGDRRVPLGGG